MRSAAFGKTIPGSRALRDGRDGFRTEPPRHNRRVQLRHHVLDMPTLARIHRDTLTYRLRNAPATRASPEHYREHASRCRSLSSLIGSCRANGAQRRWTLAPHTTIIIRWPSLSLSRATDRVLHRLYSGEANR